MPMPAFSRNFAPFARMAAALLVLGMAGCAVQPANPLADSPPPQPAPVRGVDVSLLATFTTRLAGSNEVPPVLSSALGQVDALLNTQTGLLRWKMSFSRLSGPVTGAHFHGPAPVGENAGVALAFAMPVGSPYEGRATLTEQQMADLLAGRWYVNLHTAKFPSGEIRGQMIERK